MSAIIWSVLVGVGIALHIFVIMMETGATQGGLRKKKNLRPGSNFSGRPDLYADLRNPPDLVDQAVSSHCRPGAHLQNGLCDSPDLDRLQAFRTAAENRHFPDERKSSPLSLKQCAALSFRDQRGSPALGMTMYYYSSILSFFWVVSLGFLAAVGGFSFGYWNGVRSEKVLCSIDGVLLLCLVCRAVFL